jgi:type II secretory pathway component PulF
MMNYTYLFSVMWSAGITAEEAVEKARGVVSNAWLRQELQDMKPMLAQGSTLSEAFKSSGAVEAQVIMACRNAEITGDFEGAMQQVYYFYTRKVQDDLDQFILAIRLTLFALAGFMVMAVGVAWRDQTMFKLKQ